jgi:hypothetical protein
VGAAAWPVLSKRCTLRLVDVATIEQVLARPKDGISPHWNEAPQPPHEWVPADLTDYAQVERAMAGCDAVVNLSVIREKPELAFRVNAVGVYNILKAAVKLRPKRVVQTGMICVTGYGYEGDLRYDFRIPEDFPLHPGSGLYGLSKQLGMELATVFAERHGLDVLTIVFHCLRAHDVPDSRDDHVVIPYSTAFDDLGGALECALRAPTLPRPNQVFFICAHIPTGKFSPDKPERLLGWKPKRDFEWSILLARCCSAALRRANREAEGARRFESDRQNLLRQGLRSGLAAPRRLRHPWPTPGRSVLEMVRPEARGWRRLPDDAQFARTGLPAMVLWGSGLGDGTKGDGVSADRGRGCGVGDDSVQEWAAGVFRFIDVGHLDDGSDGGVLR